MSQWASGALGERSSDSISSPSRQAWPYLQSFSSASPALASDTSAHRCPHTSHLAQSHEVLVWLGRRTWPNCVSKVASAKCTRAGNAALSILCDSRQCTMVCTSSRALPATSASTCTTTVPASVAACSIRTAARSGPDSTTSPTDGRVRAAGGGVERRWESEPEPGREGEREASESAVAELSCAAEAVEEDPMGVNLSRWYGMTSHASQKNGTSSCSRSWFSGRPLSTRSRGGWRCRSSRHSTWPDWSITARRSPLESSSRPVGSLTARA
mmetsp:Transcript_15276/g.48754  ORF Transcript_15276/g.48754 Transcript_15276/m.48754 type:complete len:270 (-) Transcript_15276:179-988(-)